MHTDLIFSLALLCQVIIVSIWLPARIRANAREMLDTHPAADYPRLYPRSPAYYERALVHFSWINWAIAALGLFAWMVFNLDESRSDYTGVAWGLFMLQGLTFVLLEVFAFRTWKLMREADDRPRRTAILKPRRLLDIVSPTQLALLGASYLSFAGFTLFISQLDLPWFSALANLLVLGGGYCMLAALLYWQWSGGRRDPYIAEQDHLRRIRYLVRQAVFVCVALTAYAVVTITLQAFELREFKPLAMSLYCQLLAVGAWFSIYQPTRINFDVYRELPGQ
ncbi:MAG: hypothetical protein ACFHX7_23040 [Pseudomonadota bacterium]